MKINLKDIMSRNDVAEYLNVSRKMVDDFIINTEIDTVKLHGKTYILKKSLESFLQRIRNNKTIPLKADVLKNSTRTPKYAVYFLIHKDEIVYIGLSKNVFDRIDRHIKANKMKFSKHTIIEVPGCYDYLQTYERQLIEYFRPKHNISNNK